MANAVTTLSLAWYFSGDERYAQKAVSYLNTWFLDKRTMMNPNLNYAQVIRGQDNDRGRSYGVIDSYSFVEMLDAVQLLQQSRSFPKKDRQQLKKWFSRFTQWLLTSPLGKQEAKNGNNHAVAYDTQVAAYALFIGDKPLAQKILSAVPEKRIYTQIEPDGRQPHELRRTLAFHYSQYNIGFFVDLALMGKKIGLDMAGQASADATVPCLRRWTSSHPILCVLPMSGLTSKSVIWRVQGSHSAGNFTRLQNILETLTESIWRPICRSASTVLPTASALSMSNRH